MSITPVKNKTFLSKLSSVLSGERVSMQEKGEAILDAVPAHYCGWAEDGAFIHSDGFLSFIGLDRAENIHQLQHAFAPGDAAALEGMYEKLVSSGAPFSLDMRNAAKDRYFRVQGKKGTSQSGKSLFLLWFDDITALQNHIERTKAEAQAAEDERLRLEAALEHSAGLVWMADDAGRILWCNKNYAAAAQSTQASVIAEQINLPFKPDKNDASKQAIVIDGKRRYFKVEQTAIAGSDHVTLFVAREETELFEKEDEHRRYISANNELLEQLGAAIAIFDSAQKLEFYNAAFAQLWQISDSFLNQRPSLGDIMEKMREARSLPEQADFRKFKKSWTDMFTTLMGAYEDMLYLPDGRALRMLCLPPPMGGLMMSFEDVTSRLELESSYNTLVAVQKETLDNLAEGVSVFGGDGKLKLWNPAFLKLWGLSPETLEGEPHVNRLLEKMKNRFDGDHWEEARESLLIQTLDRNIHEGQLQAADGMLIAYSTVPLPDGGVLVTHIDVTDKMRVENALREKNAALEAAERVKMDFLANVSYQLRTPLNAIMGFTEILEHEYFGKLSTKQHEYTKGIGEASERLLGLVNDILDLSSIEAGVMVLDKKETSVYAMLLGIYELTEEWARRERITLELKCPKNIGKFMLDERRIKQVLINLMRNAIAFTPEKGKITLQAAKSDHDLVISVIDSGPGISKADLDRIVRPFERGTDSGKKAGAGLGLALVKNIIELHDGGIMIESTKGKGTAVVLRIPLGKIS